ncbi:molybdopterin-dependent oxidoreductase [Actinotalea sp. K2]|uniref:molybdopterin-dependent oxidoreductase n=1 Tax=Actinotalea sp. K2 TaxID=2939438 RepID=UPI0020177A1F|nr:molybdopterin-dependent oxidoreductase [Actinotalea sp. K2]MCL3862243.1 molybdopterin-dependent oxidoreductase [Actinotalea sp. K2]
MRTTTGQRPLTSARPGQGPARRRAALAGVLSAGLTLGVAQLVAVAVSPGSAPLVAVGDAFVDRTPAWLKDAAIAAFGTQDKVALFVGMGLVLAALAAGAGLLARSRPAAGVAAVVALGAVGAVAAWTRPDAVITSPLPSLVGAAAGVVALLALVRRIEVPATATPSPAGVGGAANPAEADPDPGVELDRRRFLGAAVVVTAAAALSAAAGAVAGSVGRAAGAARDLIRLPAPSRPAPPLPPGVQSTTPGVVDFVTDVADFYRIDTALTVPQVDPATWTLRIHGLVQNEILLTFDELLELEMVESYVTLVCVSNPVGGSLIGNAKWLGHPLRTLLERAVPLPEADMVLSTSVDGFTASTPLGVLTDSRDAVLAVAMNDAPLPAAHGFPVRMVVPGLYGYVSATKWVVDLEVTRFADRTAYWTDRGWSAEGPVKTSSRIEVPRPGVPVPPGPVAVGGTAWAQHTGITGVEVQVDDGPWLTAQLADEASIDTWRQWSFTWDATPGAHTLRSRATDATGAVQTGTVTGVVPDGATGWHAVEVAVQS